MPNLARLYLDTARLGLMSPSAQLAARDFARLAGEGVSTLYWQNLLRGRVPTANMLPVCPSFADWQGVDGMRQRLRRLLRLPPSAPVLFASRTTSIMRGAARQLWRRCRRVLVPDTTWLPYGRIVEEERQFGGGEVVPVSVRDLVQKGQIGASDLVAHLVRAYRRQKCDGLFFAAVSHDGVRIPTAPILAALRRQANVCFAVIDGAQEFAHVPTNLAATACDIWLAGAHKWLGGNQPLGIACLANPSSAADLHEAIVAECPSRHGEDPLLRFLLYLDGRNVPDVRETVNLMPLFSTWGALCDLPTAWAAQANRFHERQVNASLICQLAARAGWQPMAIHPSLATGIVVARGSESTVRRLPAETLATAVESDGVTLTALEGGTLRLSMPAHTLDGEEQAQLARALQIGLGTRYTRAAARATW
jgi:selenocysteine lyase/cysteine desulfurase